MKRVLLFGGDLSLRGTSLYTLSLARELKLRGHRVAVLGPGGLFEGNLDSHRVPVIHAPVHGMLWRDLLYLETYAEAVRNFDAEVIHILHQDLATIGSLLSRRTGVPAVMTVHGPVSRQFWYPMGSGPSIIAVSEDVRQSLVTSGHVDRESIAVIPNGVSASLSALEEPGETESSPLPVVGTVNRIDRDRGIDLVLRAARKVLDAGTRAYFLIIGEGPAEKEVRTLARKLELIPHLTFALPRTRIASLFRPMDVYVSASHTEGHGIFLLSAMAEARPVISTGVGAVLSFLRHEENGLVVPRGDVGSLAQGILDLLADRERAHSLAVEGFRDVRERFPLRSMVERTAAAYETV